MRLPICCRKKEPPEPVYEHTDPRHWLQEIEKGFGPTTAIETCELLLQFPLSKRRTKTSPIKLQLENTELHELLLLMLMGHAKLNYKNACVKKHSFSFWGSFKGSDRPFPTSPLVANNKLETWLFQHNFKYPIKRRGKINDFAYLIDPKATLKHLNVVNIVDINKVLEITLKKALDADKEEKSRKAQAKAEAKEAKLNKKLDELLLTPRSNGSNHTASSSSSSTSSSDEEEESPYQPQLDELEEELEDAMEFAKLKEDEWGNSLPKAETQQREKVCDIVRRKIDKVRVKMAGAKFDSFRNCQKAVLKIKIKFEKQMKNVIKIAADRKASRNRAKKRLQLFDEEQEWFQHGSKYFDAPTSTPQAMRVTKELKPNSTAFDRPWIEGASSSYGWKRKMMTLVSVPFWEAARMKKEAKEQKKLQAKQAKIQQQQNLQSL
jgi:hypothetical protein